MYIVPLFIGFMVPDNLCKKNCLPLQSILIFPVIGPYLYSESLSGHKVFSAVSLILLNSMDMEMYVALHK